MGPPGPRLDLEKTSRLMYPDSVYHPPEIDEMDKA